MPKTFFLSTKNVFHDNPEIPQNDTKEVVKEYSNNGIDLKQQDIPFLAGDNNKGSNGYFPPPRNGLKGSPDAGRGQYDRPS